MDTKNRGEGLSVRAEIGPYCSFERTLSSALPKSWIEITLHEYSFTNCLCLCRSLIKAASVDFTKVIYLWLKNHSPPCTVRRLTCSDRRLFYNIMEPKYLIWEQLHFNSFNSSHSVVIFMHVSLGFMLNSCQRTIETTVKPVWRCSPLPDPPH